MSTGEIGNTIHVGDHGDVWCYQWGWSLELFGRLDIHNPAAVIIKVSTGEAGKYNLCRVESEVLDADEFRPIYDAVTEFDDQMVGFKIGRCRVSCIGFEGSAEEFVTETGGPKPDRP